MDRQKNTVVITGGSKGIGYAAAEKFQQAGYVVFELSRHGESRDGIRHITCDVTKLEECRRAVDEVVKRVGRIDVLVSNAGMGISGAVEFTAEEDVRRQMDVNFHGAVNIAQAVLPYMRVQAADKSLPDPSIVFVSSVAAVFAIPFQAFYSASKFAVNGMAMALRNEVASLGINVSCLLPGDVKTDFTASRVKSSAGSDVYERMAKAVETMEHDEQNGIAPERIAAKLLGIAGKRHPKAFYTVGWQYELFLLLNKILPATLVYRIVGMMY